MKLPKNGPLLGLITFVINAAISLIASSILTILLSAGFVGYQYAHQHKEKIATLQKLIASCIPGLFVILLLGFQYFVKGQKEVIQFLPERSILVNTFMLFLGGFALPAMLVCLGFIVGEKIGLKKSL